MERREEERKEGRKEGREGGREGGSRGRERDAGFLTLSLTLDTLPVTTSFSKSYFPCPPHLRLAQSRNQV